MSEGTWLVNETELLAWAVLRAANRTQARGTTIRLVVPHAPEVVRDLGVEEVAEGRLLAAEEWLLNRGYLALANLGHARGTYTITPVGLCWLRGEMPEPLERPESVFEEPERVEPWSGTEGAQEGAERPWWRRMFGG